MPQKELGYVELNWDCPNCGGVNPGRAQTCQNCGSPQPENVEFYQAARQEMVTDEDLISQAKAGPDIHCPYCGTRNPAGAETCKQCGGDLSEGALRKAGRVVGAYSTGPLADVACPNCGTINPGTAATCSNCGASLAIPRSQAKPEPQSQTPKPAQASKRSVPAIAIAAAGVALVAACVLLFIFLTRTTETTGIVQGGSWERSIPIEALVPVEHQAWLDEVPSGADLKGCQEEVRSVQDQPASNSVEVCGTPYSVDTGSGFAEVVQDCEYQVYDQYCKYAVDEWSQVDQAILTGDGYTASWPAPQLAEGQRLGEDQQETYTIVFLSGGENYPFTTQDYGLFQQAVPGSEWVLHINTFGGVASIEQ
jgi:ribosomal protein L40E